MGRRLIFFCWCCIFVVTFTVGYLIIYSMNSLQSQSSDLDTYDIQVPRLVLGILTPAININSRNAQRSTWLSTMQRLQSELPFQITYKFLVDHPTKETIVENNNYNDLVFLNVTSYGRAAKFGEKLYVWFKYIHEQYPDALLGTNVDDDVFLCVPQIFKRLDQLKSSKLYYELTHDAGPHVKIDTRVHDMFVVVGKDLLERIAKRQYCTGKKCNTSDLGDASFANSWLWIYDDIEYRSDNKEKFCKTSSQVLARNESLTINRL